MQGQSGIDVGGYGSEIRPDPDLQDLIPSFMENRRNELVEIERAAAAGDFESLRRLAHTWKGICRPYGFLQLEVLSRSLEEAAERESRNDVQDLARAIREHLSKVKIIYDHSN